MKMPECKRQFIKLYPAFLLPVLMEIKHGGGGEQQEEVLGN